MSLRGHLEEQEKSEEGSSVPEPFRRPDEEGGADFGFFSAAGDPEP